MRSFEILGIVLFRFPVLPRVWAILLILVNASSLIFVDTIYGQLNLAAVLAGIVTMAVIYARIGFVRLLGIGHIFWIPVLIWFGTHLPDSTVQPVLFYWVLGLMAVNIVSLVIDVIDVARFIGGEREPYYTWALSNGD